MLQKFIPIVALFISCNSKKGNNQSPSEPSPIKSANNHTILGRDKARKQAIEMLKLYLTPFYQDSLIKDSAMAVNLAEPLLFNIYGKEEIISERPYEVYQIDSLWYLSGTIPEGNEGGGFEIILDSRNARIYSITHYK